ncbi:MAG: hypothetical protein AB8F78_01185 [Saprospiraceae bacterium]
MMTRSLTIAVALIVLATAGYSQGGAYTARPSVNAQDSARIPSLAQLKADVLQAGTSRSGSINVPSEHRALFCRFDDKLDKKRIPLRMRLGSVDEVNRMEAKPGFRAGQL